mmetsp:Transcript_16248/g.37323  ORF Transcript_16248/g.37323 Transcript_16248/m.37323 type:complete len:120 (+) Transcript_16248:832-1191(+)
MVLPDKPNSMTMLASQKQSSGQPQVMWGIDCPILPGSFTGTGDLCAALWLGHTAAQQDGDDDSLATTMAKIAGTMFTVVQRTHKAFDGSSVASRELQVIASKRDIEEPPVQTFKAYRIY